MYTRLYKKIGKVLFTSFVAVCLVGAPLTHEGKPKEAEALFGLGGLVGGLVVKDIGNTLTNTIQTLSTVALEQKELVLDGLFRNIAQKALQKMTGDILTYLNSGLDGNPAFVTDIRAYLREVSDDVAGNFIYGDALSTICSPFQLDIRIALATYYQEQRSGGTKKKLECTINTPGVDMKAFLAGDFSAGGWGTWFEISLNAKNTPIGAATAAQVALNDSIIQKQDDALREADWGDGILPKKSCKTVGGGSSAKEVCSITTPSPLMKDMFSKALGTGIDSLLNADEMNEVIGALFGNLANQAISGVNGILGLGGNASFSNNSFGSSGSLSYLDALKEESATTKVGGVGDNKIQQALVTETKVLELELAIIEKVDEVTKLFTNSKLPFTNNACWKLTMPAKLSETLDELTLRIPQTVTAVASLQELAEQYKAATDATVQLDILQQFTELQLEGGVTGQTALIEYDFFLNTELKDTIAAFKKALTAQELSCQ
jgi:hypothetical protein